MGTRRVPHRATALLTMALAAGLLASCGSSGQPYAQLANHCAAPRPGVDTQGTLNDEKAWLRGWTDDLYLWYSEVPNVDPNAYATAIDYFNVLKTTQPSPTGSGNPKDRFHFWIPTDQWVAFSQSGVEAGYGLTWAVVAPSRPRSVLVAFTDPNMPAANAAFGLARGWQVLTVDGNDVVNGTDPNPLNAGLFPANVNETHTFRLQDLTGAIHDNVTLTSANVTETPVQNVGVISGTTTVGYILFNDHIATSESLLVQAITNLKQQNINDLVLDIRYNGGGYLGIASELAYMISGPSTGGKTFERIIFNDKHPTNDPVTGAPLVPVPFLTTTQGYSTNIASGTALPTLNLPRVFVLTGGSTCSASESVMNSLRGVGVQVIQVGSATCGKPYGFYPADNCGTTYFSIQFKGVNAAGFGDYSDGFIPGGSGTAGVPGCQVADDFTHALGDPAEGRLAVALEFRNGQPCPPATFAARAALSTAQSGDVTLVKPPWRENRILTSPR